MTQLIDLTGLRFGWLEIICRDENNRHKRARWRCLCDCGKETVVDGARLRIGMTKSCGCYRAVATRNAHELDIAGLRKGSMVAVQRLELIHKKGWLWLVRCDCGEEREITSGAFNAGGYMSCGCVKGS